jgi:hypothetical protein
MTKFSASFSCDLSIRHNLSLSRGISLFSLSLQLTSSAPTALLHLSLKISSANHILLEKVSFKRCLYQYFFYSFYQIVSCSIPILKSNPANSDLAKFSCGRYFWLILHRGSFSCAMVFTVIQ